MKKKCSKKSKVQETVQDCNEEALVMDGYDDAIIGMCHQFGRPAVVAYDMGKVIGILMRMKMSREEAVEYFEFNQIGAWMGECTPVFIEKF
jgi:hypothetical protein